MKVVAFNGSARKDGNTAILLRTVLTELERENIATELIQLAGAFPDLSIIEANAGADVRVELSVA